MGLQNFNYNQEQFIISCPDLYNPFNKIPTFSFTFDSFQAGL